MRTDENVRNQYDELGQLKQVNINYVTHGNKTYVLSTNHPSPLLSIPSMFLLESFPIDILYSL